MKHRIIGKKLGRNHNQRQALFRSLTRSFFEKGSMETTDAKSKAISPLINKLTLYVLRKDVVLASRRLNKYINDKHLVSSIIKAVKGQLDGINGNFLKTTRIKYRVGDNSLIVRLEFVKPYTLAPKSETKVENKKVSKEVKKETKAPKKVTKKAAK